MARQQRVRETEIGSSGKWRQETHGGWSSTAVHILPSPLEAVQGCVDCWVRSVVS